MLEPMIPPPTMVILLMVRLLGSIQQPSDGKPPSLADCRRCGRPLVRVVSVALEAGSGPLQWSAAASKRSFVADQSRSRSTAKPCQSGRTSVDAMPPTADMVEHRVRQVKPSYSSSGSGMKW